eukprot:gene2163-2583_t
MSRTGSNHNYLEQTRGVGLGSTISDIEREFASVSSSSSKDAYYLDHNQSDSLFGVSYNAQALRTHSPGPTTKPRHAHQDSVIGKMKRRQANKYRVRDYTMGGLSLREPISRSEDVTQRPEVKAAFVQIFHTVNYDAAVGNGKAEVGESGDDKKITASSEADASAGRSERLKSVDSIRGTKSSSSFDHALQSPSVRPDHKRALPSSPSPGKVTNAAKSTLADSNRSVRSTVSGGFPPLHSSVGNLDKSVDPSPLDHIDPRQTAADQDEENILFRSSHQFSKSNYVNLACAEKSLGYSSGTSRTVDELKKDFRYRRRCCIAHGGGNLKIDHHPPIEHKSFDVNVSGLLIPGPGVDLDGTAKDYEPEGLDPNLVRDHDVESPGVNAASFASGTRWSSSREFAPMSSSFEEVDRDGGVEADEGGEEGGLSSDHVELISSLQRSSSTRGKRILRAKKDGFLRSCMAS